MKGIFYREVGGATIVVVAPPNIEEILSPILRDFELPLLKRVSDLKRIVNTIYLFSKRSVNLI